MGIMFASVEFAYNWATHSTIKVRPFQVVYGFNLRAPIDLLPLSTTERIHSDASARAEFIVCCVKPLKKILKR